MSKGNVSDPVVLTEARDASHPGWWTALAVLVVAWVGIPFALPVAAALPWYLYWRRSPEHRLAPTVRWALAAWVTGAAALALAGRHALRSIPLGAESAAAAHAWLDGTAGAVPSWTGMVVAVIAFALASVVLRGALGAVVLAGALLVSAVHASVVFARSWNLLAAVLFAIPPWSLFMLAGMVLSLDLLAGWGEARRGRGPAQDGIALARRRWLAGAGLVAAGLAARWLLAGPLSELARRATIP